jgi:hypothetical protein
MDGSKVAIVLNSSPWLCRRPLSHRTVLCGTYHSWMIEVGMQKHSMYDY